MMRVISKRELSLHNGQDRDEVWVSVDGTVYDVSTSRLWRKGRHYDHWAGQELAGELAEAPHLPDVVNKFPIIGKLEDI